MKFGHGGARPGAGKKKGTKWPSTIEKEALRERLRARVAQALDPMTDAQIAAAQGLKYLVARQKKGGKFVHLTQDVAEAILGGENTEYDAIEVWEKLPNTQAFTDLMNRTLDKPAEQVTLDANVNVSVEGRAERVLAARKRADGKR